MTRPRIVRPGQEIDTSGPQAAVEGAELMNGAELQALIEQSITGSGSNRVGDRIDLPRGTIELTDTVDVASGEGGAAGVHLCGRGRATRLRWLGPADRPVFRFVDGSGCELSDVTLEFGARAHTAVQMYDSGAGPARSSRNVLRNVHVPDASGLLGTFWHVGGGADQKNDFMRGYDLDIAGCETGVLIEGRHSLNHELYGCLFKGRTAGRTAVRTLAGGSVRMVGGAIVQFSDAAYDIDTRNGVALVASGVHLEKCARLITAPPREPPATTTHVVILDGMRWGSDAAEIADDEEIVSYSGGTLLIRGCWFWTGTPQQTVYRFRYETTQQLGDFVFEDCRVRSSNEAGHWTGMTPTSVRGSLLYVGSSTQPRPMPAS